MHRVEETPKKLKLDQELLSYQLAIRAKGGVRNTKLGARNTRCERIRKVQIHRSVKKKDWLSKAMAINKYKTRMSVIWVELTFLMIAKYEDILYNRKLISS